MIFTIFHLISKEICMQRGAGKILVAPLTPAVCQPLLLEFAYHLPTLYTWQISSTYPFDESTVLYTRC